MAEQIFVALASHMDFLPKIGRPVYIGPDVLAETGEKGRRERIDGDVLADPFTGPYAPSLAYTRVLKLQEKILEFLTLALNDYHGQIHSDRYWRILLGEWPLHYLSLLYGHYVRLKVLREKYPDFTTYVLDPVSFYVPANSQEFFDLATGPYYGLQVYSKILKFWGLKYPGRTLKINEEKDRARNGQGAIEAFLTDFTDTPFFRNPFAKVFIYQPTWSVWNSLRLFWKTKGEIGLGTAPMRRVEPKIRERSTTREKLKEKIHFTDEFELLAAHMMIEDLPLSFLEGLRTLRGQAREINSFGPEYILAGKALAFDDAFKFWAAGKVEEGNTLMVVQEDLTDTIFTESLRREHQIKIADVYLSCTESFAHIKAAPLPLPRLAFASVLSYNENLQKILYISAIGQCFLHLFPATAFNTEQSLSAQDKLIESFPQQLFSRLQVRFIHEDPTKERRRRLSRLRPQLAIDQIPDYFQSIKEARLLVFGELSSHAIEALAYGRPVVFLHEYGRPLGPHVAELLNDLEQVGILQRSVEQLVSFIGTHYENIGAWWAEAFRRQTVARVLHALALADDKSSQLWLNKLNSLKKKKVR